MSKYTVTALVVVSGAAISSAITGFSDPGYQINFAVGAVWALTVHWWMSR